MREVNPSRLDLRIGKIVSAKKVCFTIKAVIPLFDPLFCPFFVFVCIFC